MAFSQNFSYKISWKTKDDKQMVYVEAGPAREQLKTSREFEYGKNQNASTKSF